jgi:hypothetical protein
MDILQSLLYAASSSLWSVPQKSLHELSSPSAFAQEVCPKLIHEIRALPKVDRPAIARGLLPTRLAEFQANLSKFGVTFNEVDDDKTLRALDSLERLCQVVLPLLTVNAIHKY